MLALREMVLRGDFAPGERLAELTLVPRLRASRTPVRLALDQLAHEGLLEALPTTGFRVRQFAPADIRDAIEIRGVLEGVVYGVSVPGADGRAGTAALLVDSEFDLAAFRAAVAAQLPAYARPVFLRILSSLEATGTFKPRKQDLLQAGFDPSRSADPLYFDDPSSGRYVVLDAAVYAGIVAGKIRI